MGNRCLLELAGCIIVYMESLNAFFFFTGVEFMVHGAMSWPRPLTTSSTAKSVDRGAYILARFGGRASFTFIE